jgi:predicted 3-demethylubiquinone-9 3-methyltransferase (glyoxalase superfamily)
MNKLAPFLWFNDNADEAAEFYLSVFPHARKLDELRSKALAPGPWARLPPSKFELEGQEMVSLNGGTPRISSTPPSRSSVQKRECRVGAAAEENFVRCDSQQEIDSYWGKRRGPDGTKPNGFRSLQGRG